MADIDLKKFEKSKYNPWFGRQILTLKNKDDVNLVNSIRNRQDLTPLVKSALYFHEVTKCNGFEFVAYSNIRFDDFIILPNNAILVPWFLNDKKARPITDPWVVSTMQMEHHSNFVYDGWIEINQWDEEFVKNVIQSISEALSLFSLTSELFFKWEPKYPIEKKPPQFCEWSTKENTPHNMVFNQIRELNNEDRRAIYRSIS